VTAALSLRWVVSVVYLHRIVAEGAWKDPGDILQERIGLGCPGSDGLAITGSSHRTPFGAPSYVGTRTVLDVNSNRTVSVEEMVIVLKYDITDITTPKGETDKGLSLGSKPDWSAQGDFHYFRLVPSGSPVRT
jgi:hypothetical protein